MILVFKQTSLTTVTTTTTAPPPAAAVYVPTPIQAIGTLSVNAIISNNNSNNSNNNSNLTTMSTSTNSNSSNVDGSTSAIDENGDNLAAIGVFLL